MRVSEKQMDVILEEMRSCCAKLMEFGCDSVQIIGTASLVGDNSAKVHAGKGNLYARWGSVDEWLQEQKDYGLANELACAVNSDRDEGY